LFCVLNKVLLKHSYIYSLIWCQHLLLYYSSYGVKSEPYESKKKKKSIIYPASYRKVCWYLLHVSVCYSDFSQCFTFLFYFILITWQGQGRLKGCACTCAVCACV
jgi:hypothetical protein